MSNSSLYEKITIDDAYNPERVRIHAQQLGQCLERYYAECQSLGGRTLPTLDPGRYVEMAADLLEYPKADFRELVELALKFSHRLHDPRYMGHQVPPTIPTAALFDTIGKATNQGAAVFEMAPFGTAAEKALIQKMGKMIGWTKGKFAGIGTHGGTLANVTALLAARNVRYQDGWKQGFANSSKLKPAIMTSAESHYCIARACGILGIGTEQLIKVPVDKKRRMDTGEARRLLDKAKDQGLDVFAIVGSACTTPTGSFDNLRDVGQIAKDYGLWFHVDGAHGASFLFSDKHRHILDGIDLADSVAWDAHKMLFVPALCTYLFYKDAKHSWEAFSQDAPYLFDPSDPQGMAEFDGGLRTFECTKGAMSLGLWGVWSLYGKQFIASLIEKAVENTHLLYEKISKSNDFEVAHEPQCNILCFRYLPADRKNISSQDLSSLQQKIRQQLLHEGEGYITATKLDGEYWLRVTVINPLTDDSHLRALLGKIRTVGAVFSPSSLPRGGIEPDL